MAFALGGDLVLESTLRSRGMGAFSNLNLEEAESIRPSTRSQVSEVVAVPLR